MLMRLQTTSVKELFLTYRLLFWPFSSFKKQPALSRQYEMAHTFRTQRVDYRWLDYRGIGYSFAPLNPRFKCTISNATAAGVTPEIRLACPTVSGLCWLSFCCTSADKPLTLL